MCRRFAIALKTRVIHGELQVPIHPAGTWAPLRRARSPRHLPGDACPGCGATLMAGHRLQGSEGRAGEHRLHAQKSRKAVSCAHHTDSHTVGFLEPMPFFTSSFRHLPGNIQGKSPTSATSPVLETLFPSFYSHYSFILLIRRPPRLTASCCYSLRAAVLLPSLIFPKVFLGCFQNRQCTSHLL